MGLKKVLSPNRKKKYVVVGKKDQLPTADAELGSTASTGELPAPPQNGPLPTKPPEQEKSLTVGDNVFLQLFVVIACAMFFRRLWMLHGITILFLRRMLILGLRWFDFFMDTGVFHEIMSITGYIFRFAFKNTEKVLQGDSLRMFFAASWLQNFNSWGYHVWLVILREQYKQVNKAALAEMENVMEGARTMNEKLH